MTVSTTDSVVEYVSGGPDFPIPYRFLQDSDIEAVLVKQDGTSETLTGSQYTLTGQGAQNGGTLTSVYAASVLATPGASLTISRIMDDVQPTDLRNQGKYFAETHENVFDRLTMLIQQGFASLYRALLRPLGKNYYDAQGRNISNLADPVSDQDATTRRWSREYITSLISAIQGPINNALNIFFKGPDNLNYVVQDLADKTDPAKGGSLVGWLQSGAGAVGRTVAAKLRDRVAIGDYGGIDDNSTDNSTAFTRAKTFVGNGGTFRLVRRVAAIFKFSTPVDLGGVVIENDTNLVMSLTESQFPITGSERVSVLRRLRMYFSNQNYNYDFYPEQQEELAEKRIWLDESDFDLSYRENFDLSTLTSMQHETLSWPNGDTWTTASNVSLGSNGADWPFLLWSAGAASTWHRSSFSVREGDDVCVSFSTGGVYNRACFVQHAGGYLALYATGVAGALNFVRKDVGVAPVVTTVGVGDVFTTQPQYFGENSVWRVRVVTKRQFVILLNGQQVGGLLSAPGEIIRVGFGYMPQSVSSVAVSGFVRTRNARAGGRQPEGITIYGDSMSAPIHGGWPFFMRKALESAAGTVVEVVTNRAIPGYTTAQMYTAMQAQGFNGGLALICGGTNDIQDQVGVPTLMTNITNMVTYARGQGQTPIVWIPPLWYTQAEAQAAGAPAGTGQASVNATAGADYRSNLERLCSKLNVKCVDMTLVTGPIDAKYLTATGGADILMRDNIHPSAYLYKRLGLAMAKAILGERSGGIKRRREVQSLPITYAAGWSAYPSSGEVAQMLLSNDGAIHCMGKISSPVSGVSNGALVGTLREDLRPIVPFSAPASGSGGNCRVYVSTTGAITVDNFGLGWTYLDLSSVNFVTAQ